MLASVAGRDLALPGERMSGRGDRDQFDVADRAALELGVIDEVGPADREVGLPVEHQRGDGTERLDVEPEVDGREHRLEIAQHAGDDRAREHHVDRQREFGLEPLADAAGAGHQPVDLAGHRARIGEQRAAGVGQLGAARALAFEQPHAELRLERRDPVADHRERAAEPFRSAVEAAFLGHREEDAQLVEGRLADLHYSTLSNILNEFIRVFLRACKRHLQGQDSDSERTRR